MATRKDNLDIKASDIKAILEDLQKSLSAQNAEKLAKSEELKKAEEKSASASESSTPASASPEESASAAPEGSASGSAEMPAEGAAPAMDHVEPEMGHMDPAHEEALSPEELHAEYSALPDDVLHAHYLACKKALLARHPAPATPSAPAEMPAMKAEMPAGKEMEVPKTSAKQPIEKENQALKSEDAALKAKLETLEVQNAELNKAVDLLAKGLHQAIGKPQRKGITNLSFVDRNEVQAEKKDPSKVLSKKEVQEHVRPLLAKMTARDRSKLMDFYEDRISFDKISHLMEK
jgi:hypothetical protein